MSTVRPRQTLAVIHAVLLAPVRERRMDSVLVIGGGGSTVGTQSPSSATRLRRDNLTRGRRQNPFTNAEVAHIEGDRRERDTLETARERATRT